MTQRESRYRAPRVPVDAVPVLPSSRRPARVFVTWLVGASLVRGAALALQIGYALATFGTEERLAGLLVVSAEPGNAADEPPGRAPGYARCPPACPAVDCQDVRRPRCS